MKILITGNMGYVGPCVVQHFRKVVPEASVAGLDAGFFATCLMDPSALPEYSVDVQHFADVRRPPEDLFRGVDAVVHLAGISNDPIGNQFRDVTMAINHEATVELARQARRAGVGSFVFASSCSVYGCAEDGARSETSAVNPLTAYAKSKVESERSLEPLASSDFVITCLRFATACGMSPRLRLDLVLNDFVAAAITAKRIEILSDGTPWRPLIDVKDMARAIEWAAFRRASNGGSFVVVNAGSDEWNYQVKDLALGVAAAIPGTEISINHNAPPDRRSYRVSFARFRELAPRHQPQNPFAATVRELRHGLEAAGFADPDFRNSGFIRLKALSNLMNAGRLSSDLTWSARVPELVMVENAA